MSALGKRYPTDPQSAQTERAPARFRHHDLCRFAKQLLEAAGMQASIAADVAEVLVEGDLLGHDTHGLQLLLPYLRELDRSTMTRSGTPTVLAERSVAATWDGHRLPGPWLVRQAIAWAAPRARAHGSATVVIRRSHHIACLAAYLEAPAREGLLVQISSSDPAVASVAPFGGTRPVMTPNPLAVGIPTSGDPIMIDISASVTTNGMSARLRDAGERGAQAWWLDAAGRATDDPAVLFADPPGTILPLGGLDAGHKGYGLGLMVEALTGALAGHGRADPAEGWGATVCIQIHDPAAFAGREAFDRQTDWLAHACRTTPAREAGPPVRLPGERGLARKRAQLAQGVALHTSIMPALQARAKAAGIDPVEAL